MKFHQATVDTLDGRKPAATSNKDEDASQPPRPPVPQPPPQILWGDVHPLCNCSSISCVGYRFGEPSASGMEPNCNFGNIAERSIGSALVVLSESSMICFGSFRTTAAFYVYGNPMALGFVAFHCVHSVDRDGGEIIVETDSGPTDPVAFSTGSRFPRRNDCRTRNLLGTSQRIPTHHD